MNTILPFLRRWTLGLLLAAAAWVPTSTAALIAHDPLYYDPGSGWEERNGGEGWSGSWFSTLSVATNGLAYPGLATSGRSFVTTGFGGSDQRPLDTARFPALVTDDRFGDFGRTNTVLWISFLARRQPGDDSVSPFDFFGLQLSLGFSDRILIGSPRGSTNVWGVTAENSGVPSTNRFTSRPIVDNAVTLLVARLTFGPAGLNDSVALFVDPPLGGDPGSPDLVVAGLDFQFDGIAAAYSGRSHRIELDEPRLGETFADVTPVGSAAPQAFSLTALPDGFSREFQPIHHTVAVVEPLEPGRTVTLSITGAPPGSVFTPATGEFAWTPGELDGLTSHHIGFVAVDNSVPPQTNARIFRLFIDEDNQTPELAHIGPLGVDPGETLDWTLVVTDADQPPQSLGFWLEIGPDGLELDSTGRITWTPTASQWDLLHPVVFRISDSLDSFPKTLHVYARSQASTPLAPPPLRLEPRAPGLALAWEDQPGSLVVQATPDLAEPTWRTLPGTSVLEAGMRWLTLAPTNDAAFFRLRNLDAVRLTHATPRSFSLAPGTNVFVDLGLTGDIGVDDVLEVTAFGLFDATVRRIPGSALRDDGGLGFYLDTSSLPLAETAIAVRVLDSQGGRHGLSVFSVTNAAPQTSGSAPEIRSLAWPATAEQVRIPTSSRDVVTPALFVDVVDPDGDAARFGLRITRADFSSDAWEMPVEPSSPSPTQLVLFPLTLDHLSPQGTWSVEVTAIDAAGRRSPARSLSLQVAQFTADDALAGPVLRSFTPTNGPAGSTVTLTTERIDLAALSNAVVRIGGRIATTVGVGTNRLIVLVPTETAGGAVTLDTPLGRTAAFQRFFVLPELNLAPTVAAALPGQTLEFGFDRRLPEAVSIVWSVIGPGQIDAAGRFTAPASVPLATQSRVRATVSFPGTNVVAEALVEIEASRADRTEVLVRASAGGEVWTEDLLGRIEIPIGALPVDTRVRIERKTLASLPPSAAAPGFLGALELGPDGTTFSRPVTVWLPLERSLPPGTELTLRFWNESSQTWTEEGLVARVEPDGLRARAEITHFSIPAVFGQPVVAGPTPELASLSPAVLLEGDARPILLTGTNLHGDVTLEVRRRDGSVLPGLVVGPLVRPRGLLPSLDAGDRAAFLLDVPVLPELADGQSLELEVRVHRGDGPVSTLPLTVAGLDEFNAATFGRGVPGQRLTNLFSEIVVDRPLWNLRHDVVDLRATRRISLAAEVDLSGRGGASPAGPLQDGPASGMVLAMGPGLRDGAGSTADARFVATYEMPSSTMTVGRGGANGAAARDVDSLRQVAGCHGDDAIACFAEILDDLADDPFDELEDAPGELADLLARLPDGRRGSAGLWAGAPSFWIALATHSVATDNPGFLRFFGPGSGGGGGGNSGSLFGIPRTRQAGGGGGEGGGAVRFVSGRDLTVGAPIRANGGAGGNGGRMSSGGYELLGGGGGGGGAGAIRLRAGRSLNFTGPQAFLQARGGQPGFGGFATRERSIGFGLRLELPYREDPETPTGMQVAEGALFDETQLANGVVVSNVLRLEARRFPAAWFEDHAGTPRRGPDRPHVVVRRADGSAQRRCYFHPVGDPNHSRFAVNLVFFPGENVVELGGPGEELLDRHVVCLSGPDLDGDGLSNADEAGLGTDPAGADGDGDTLSDLDELLHGGDPTADDADGDLVRDDVEVALGTHPSGVDTDGDGLWDSLEIFLGRSPTETSPRDLHYDQGTVFTVADNALGEKILALLDPTSGRLGALGRIPGNRADGITFDYRGTLYLSQGDTLLEWAGSVPYERPNAPAAVGPVRVSGSPRSQGSGVVGVANLSPAAAPPSSRIADLRTIINAAGQAIFAPLGSLRSTNALGAFVLPVAAGPMTYDPFPGAFNRIHGIATAGGAAGNTFHLTNHNRFVPPLVEATIPGNGVGQPVKALAFGRPTGYFALLATPGGDDVLHEISPYAQGLSGSPYSLGRSDALAAVHVVTNEFLITTTSRQVLRIQLQPLTHTLTSTLVGSTAAPCPLLAIVPCVEGCFDPNPVSGSGALGPNFVARGFREADFNGDGHLDLAVVGELGQQAKLHVLHGDGTGRFTAVAEHVLGQGSIASAGKIAPGRANADGLVDLAVGWGGSFNSGRISVLLGTANGQFSAPTEVLQTGTGEFGFALGDFDGAGSDDLALARNTGFVVAGDAAGAFAQPIQPLTPNNLASRLAEFVDLDGSGRPDLIRFGEIIATHIDGALAASFQRVAGFGGGDTMELGDWDGDGHTDLFFSGYSGFVTVVPGMGNGAFGSAVTLISGTLFGSVPRFGVGDLDADGLSEIAMPDPFNRLLRVYRLGRPGGGYFVDATLSMPFIPLAARFNDFNGDGIADIAVMGTTGAIQVLLGR